MGNQNDIVIISAARTPFSKFGGLLKQIHSIELGAMIIREVLQRSGLKGSDIDEVYYGMCIQSEAALKYNVVARQAMLHAGLPPETLSLTVDRACCSSLAAVQLGRKSLLLDEAKVCMAVGAENMSNTPVVLNGHRWGTGLGKPEMVDHLNPIMYVGFNSLAGDAGAVALEYDVSREMQDAWAYASQMKYQAAKAAGKFRPGEEVAAIELSQKKGDPVIFAEDEFPKPNTTPEGLAKLPPVYGSATVTAGNAPGLDAGASALIITKRATADALGVKPLGVILSVASVASAPRGIAEVPAFAIQKALDRASVQLENVDLIEINEAFAAMPLVSTKILADGDQTKWEELLAKTNPNGGAIAIGHPVGASGARILMTAMYELRRRGGGVGVVGICGGLAQGDAAVISVDESCL
ncbi:thiolase [Geobacter metallireducens GS-15]|uniref:Thiolase n=1 Tax=Geobacter metallireducens (strain ATCC 53774 / DSM 7210 / GS-15) TaxID=269799 RepID=Q39TD0_GEOMG|nr:thiolase family protein [Geobacter metallireducens]ABB32494.1 thiolase [Geobacter metallireducens GS-15]